MRLALAASIAAAITVGEASHASAQCDGGGNNGSTGSSSSAGEYRESAPRCIETSPVVGYSTCRRFGEWDASHRPALGLSIGASGHRLNASSIDIRGVAEHPDLIGDPSFAIAAPTPDNYLVGGTIDLRMALQLTRHLYAGLEGQYGRLTTAPLKGSNADAALAVTPSRVTYVTASALAGVKAPIGDWVVRGELALGIEAFAVAVETVHETCELTETAFDVDLALRPRALLERFVSPWLNVGVAAGSNLLRRGDGTVSLFFGGHLRAFDGL